MRNERDSYERGTYSLTIDWSNDESDTNVFIEAPGALTYEDALALGRLLVAKLTGEEE